MYEVHAPHTFISRFPFFDVFSLYNLPMLDYEIDKLALLASKLFRPVLPTTLVARHHLIEQLNEGLVIGRSLTLVSAPAGYGKSTLVAEWLQQVNRPVAWLSLGESDDNARRFFLYLIAAFRQVNVPLSAKLQAALEAGQLPPQQVLVSTLVNDLAEMKSAYLLVLDDFQVIEDKMVLGVLHGLVLHQPHQLHLVLITREDPALPLGRLRANNQLTEIRAADLRFRQDEAEQFLCTGMGLTLTKHDLSRLDERTEGWIAGLQLAALALKSSLSLPGHGNAAEFIESLSGSHRFFLGYLTEEVLKAQPPEVQDFLLQTSVLSRLSGDLCDAITGYSGSATLLEDLLAANLFLIPLDDEWRWYRYHHLFADLLRNQLQRTRPQQIAVLHQRASRWYEDRQMPLDAIEHALLGKDFERVITLLEAHGWRLLNQGFARKMEAWMKAIPAELRAYSPRTNLGFAWMHMLRGNFGQVIPYLDQAESVLDQAAQDVTQKTALQAECLALRSNLWQVQGHIPKSIEAAQQALQLLGTEDLRLTGLAWLGLGGAYRQSADYERAVKALENAIRCSRASQELVTEMLAVAHLTLMSLQFGRLHYAVEVASQAIEWMKSINVAPPPIVGAVYGALGWIYYEWNQLEKARVYLLQGIELSTFSGHNASLVYTKVSLARLQNAEGKPDQANQTLAEAEELYRMGAPAWVGPELIAQQVRLSLAQGDLSEAERILRQSEVSPEQPVVHQTDALHLAWLRLLSVKGQGLPLAERIIASAEAGGRNGTLLQALISGALDQSQDAYIRQAWLARALELAETEGYLRIFIDEGAPMAALLEHMPASAYITRLLALFPTHQDSAHSPTGEGLIEPLSEREVEVLALLAEGLTYGEAAERLVVSLNTVRYHVKSVYGKLGVEKRVQAIETARRLGLL
jgi:LuxR family transcriptional regulator, maltose regulon positive regulatory protein